jgi:hypothetical protein
MGFIETESQVLKQSNSLCLTAKDVLPLVNDIQALNNSIATPKPILYTKYVALITQEKDLPPVVTVLENEWVPVTIEWIRLSPGVITGKLSSGTFNQAKTFVLISENNPNSSIYISVESAVIIIHSFSNGTLEDSLIQNVPIEIRVYK